MKEEETKFTGSQSGAGLGRRAEPGSWTPARMPRRLGLPQTGLSQQPRYL